jgi:hypothetical protein
LHNQGNTILGVYINTGNEYPHLIVKNPNMELLEVGVKTEIYPTMLIVESNENSEEVYKVSNHFNAMPVSANILLTSTRAKDLPKCGGEYFGMFSGLKEI